jgi:hypothetical protein
MHVKADFISIYISRYIILKSAQWLSVSFVPSPEYQYIIVLINRSDHPRADLFILSFGFTDQKPWRCAVQCFVHTIMLAISLLSLSTDGRDSPGCYNLKHLWTCSECWLLHRQCQEANLPLKLLAGWKRLAWLSCSARRPRTRRFPRGSKKMDCPNHVMAEEASMRA